MINCGTTEYYLLRPAASKGYIQLIKTAREHHWVVNTQLRSG